MITQQVLNFTTIVNTNQLGKHFKEYSQPAGYTNSKNNSPYWEYVSKEFYGAVIRSKISLETADSSAMVVSVRLKGRSTEDQPVTGVRIDLIEIGDPRLASWGVDAEELPEVNIDVIRAPGNIVLAPQPALASAFFYKRSEGATVIQFTEG